MDEILSSMYLTAIDYAVLGIMLTVSMLLGIYFAFFVKNKQSTAAMFLMGGQKLRIIPVAMSLIVTQMAGPSTIGLPTEVYIYGTQIWIFSINQALANFVMITVFFPVYRNLKITSIFEYLRKRFDNSVRLLGSVLYIIRIVIILPIIVYAPAIVLAQVTGLKLEIWIPIASAVAVFYTTLGGIKAVVWTDAIQIVLIIIGIFTVAIVGTYQAGGVKNVWKRNKETGRIDFFNMDFNPFIRHTFWNILIGKFFTQLSTYSANQSIQQRFLSLPSVFNARITALVFGIGVITLMGTCCYIGLVMAVTLHDCDPITAGIVARPDQILPYFIMKTVSHIPAMPGIFITGICSAAIGATAIGLNSAAAVIMVDFIKPFYKKPMTEMRESFYMKLIIVIFGIITTLSTYIVDKLGTLVQITASLSGVTDGTVLGLFSMGMLLPWVNSTGAFWGSIISLIFSGWIIIGAQIAIIDKQITFPTKPLSTDGCDNATVYNYYNNLNRTWKNETYDPGEPFFLYSLSYTYYTLMGFIITIIFGLMISFMTRPNDVKHMERNLFSPIIHKFFNGNEIKEGTELKLIERKNEKIKNGTVTHE